MIKTKSNTTTNQILPTKEECEWKGIELAAAIAQMTVSAEAVGAVQIGVAVAVVGSCNQVTLC
jgi:dUTPase